MDRLTGTICGWTDGGLVKFLDGWPDRQIFLYGWLDVQMNWYIFLIDGQTEECIVKLLYGWLDGEIYFLN